MRIFFGVVFLALAAGLFYGHRAKLKKLGRIVSTEICTVEHLKTLASSMAEGFGSGSLRFPAAVSGHVRCAEPLVSELSETPSIHYSMTVLREFKEPRNSSGGKRQNHRGSKQMASSDRSVPFQLEDASGVIRVEPSGAKFTAEQTLSRFEQASAGGHTIEVGSYVLEAPPAVVGGSTTVGYRFSEQTIPVDQEIFVLGEVTDPDGELRIEIPEGDENLLISVKGRSQLIKDLGSGAKGLKTASIVFAVIGALLVVL